METSLSFLLFLSACSTFEAESARVRLHDDPVTVASVSFESATPVQAWVEYGTTRALGEQTPLEADATVDHDITLLGLRADTTYHYEVRFLEHGQEQLWSAGTFTTDPLPDDLPTLDTDGEADPDMGYTLFPYQRPDNNRLCGFTSAIYAVDPAGEIVWYAQVEGLVLSARPSLDGTGVLVQATRVTPEGDYSTIERLPFAGGPVESHPFPYIHHDFVELPDGRIVSIQADPLSLPEEGLTVIGDRLVAMDADGEEEELWNAFDHLPLEWNEGWEESPVDWTHANGLAYDPETDRFALSLFRQRQVLLLSGDGEPLGSIGEGGDYTIHGDAGFGPQHAPRFTEDGLQLFDNAGDGASRVVGYTLDEEARTATFAWDYHSPDGRQTLVLGDGERLADGSVVSAWGELGEVLTTTSSGQVARSIRSEAGAVAVGRVQVFPSFYP